MGPFLSCDWGTSRFRLRLIDGPDLRVVAEHVTDEGVQPIASAHAPGTERDAAFAGALDRGIAALGAQGRPEIPAVLSGMASSNLGWRPLPYARLPQPVDGSRLVFRDLEHDGRRLRIVSGVQAESDVLRGEEIELVGLFSAPARRELAEGCIAILPGTHSKHLRLEAGWIAGFTTHLTGELYRLLCDHSTLREPGASAFDSSAFIEGVRRCRAMGLTAALFQTRARKLLGLLPASHGEAFLSGVLIGAELADLENAAAQRIVLAAGESLGSRYALALEELMPAAGVVIIPPDEVAAAVIAGHARILASS